MAGSKQREGEAESIAQRITKVGVIGAGTMGHGIAQTFAQAGFQVKINDVSKDFIDGGIRRIEGNLSRSVEKGKLSQSEKSAILGRILPSSNLNDFSDLEFVVEAVLEKFEVKREVFKDLDRICGKNVIFASNTSSIPITELAALVSNPQRVAGMHFFNPVPVMKLIEIVQALQTSDSTIGVIKSLSHRLGKTAVVVKDTAGFVSNRLVCPMINEAIFAYEQGIASKEDIDTVMKLGMNHPMGPLELADFVGLDIVLDVLDVLYKEYEDPKYRASPLLRNMVRAGYLGRKTKKGFYEYP
jgi:3-hydroxybutyryl-CoA dehydrogenase